MTLHSTRNNIPRPEGSDTPVDLPALFTARDVIIDKFTQGDSGTGAGLPSASDPLRLYLVTDASPQPQLHVVHSTGVLNLGPFAIPTSSELAALAGTSGSPGSGNKYVTDADARNTNARAPTAHAASHYSGGSDPLVGFGAALPGSPVDGQLFDLLVDATNGIIWRFRYRSASASTYKWEFVGGSPLYKEVTTAENTTSGSFVALATAGPSITLPTLPSGGDFDVAIGAIIVPGTTSGVGLMSYDIGATPASTLDSAVVAGTGAGLQVSAMRTRRKTALPSVTALVSKYESSGGGGGTSFSFRFMSVLPVRVG